MSSDDLSQSLESQWRLQTLPFVDPTFGPRVVQFPAPSDLSVVSSIQLRFAV
jgi:hypothetical protein